MPKVIRPGLSRVVQYTDHLRSAPQAPLLTIGGSEPEQSRAIGLFTTKSQVQVAGGHGQLWR